MSEIFLNNTIMLLHRVVLVQLMTILLLNLSALPLMKMFMFIQFWKVRDLRTRSSRLDGQVGPIEQAVRRSLISYVTKFFGKCDPNAPQMKLCTVPKNTKLIETTASGKPFRYPVVTVENVIVLPGIPQLFERSINNLIGYWETDRAGGASSTTQPFVF